MTKRLGEICLLVGAIYLGQVDRCVGGVYLVMEREGEMGLGFGRGILVPFACGCLAMSNAFAHDTIMWGLPIAPL